MDRVKIKFSELSIGDIIEHLNPDGKTVMRKIVSINKDKTVALVQKRNGSRYRIRNKDLIRLVKSPSKQR